MNFCAIAALLVFERISACGVGMQSTRCGFSHGAGARGFFGARDDNFCNPCWPGVVVKRSGFGSNVDVLGVGFLTVTGGSVRTTETTITNPTALTGDVTITADTGVSGTVSVTGTTYTLSLAEGDSFVLPVGADYNIETRTVTIPAGGASISNVGSVEVTGGTIVDSAATDITGPAGTLTGTATGDSSSGAASETTIDGTATAVIGDTE